MRFIIFYAPKLETCKSKYYDVDIEQVSFFSTEELHARNCKMLYIDSYVFRFPWDRIYTL